MPPRGQGAQAGGTPSKHLLLASGALDMHKLAGEKGDAHLCDFLESKFLDEQVEAIKKVSDLITKLKRAGPGLGEHIIDKEIS